MTPFQPPDAQWFDALSRFDSTDFSSALHDDVDAMLKDMPSLNAGGLGLPAIQEPGPHVPDPPLIFAEKEFVFVPVPAEVRGATVCGCALRALLRLPLLRVM